MNNNTLFASPIRLAEISVCNWGSFNGLHTAPIDPHGTLITGDNAAGKSTFVDGLMALLLPMRGAAFNVAAAQGDKSDRSVLSYIRGSFGADHEGSNTRIKYKRNGAVLTGLRALYRSDEGKEITLLAVLLANAGANSLSEIKRIYLVGKENVRLSDVLNQLREGNIRQFNQWLKTQQHLISFDERFKDYQAYYRQCLYMDNENAPALLSRALGLKKIDDLTKLIRELVLEPNDIREEARKIVAEFEDLAHIHARMLDARAQVTHLQDLPALQNKLQQNQKNTEQLLAQRQALPIYYAQYRATQLREQLAELSGSLKQAEQEIINKKQQFETAKEAEQQRYAEYSDAGGNRIAVLMEQEKNLQKQHAFVFQAAQDYQNLCRQLNIADELHAPTFTRHQTQSETQIQQLKQQHETAEQQFTAQAGKVHLLEQQLNDLKTEISEIEQRPNSNLPTKQQQWRDDIQAAFRIPAETLMFIGEMLDVSPEHSAWQGAIERALGGLRTTLLVPKNQFNSINQWINQRHMKAHIRIQAVDSDKTQIVEFQEQGYLSKLIWREHLYQDWLRSFLFKRDLICVDNMAEFERTPFSITRQGLQHLEYGRSEKKDQQHIDDKHFWYLGFSNKNRLSSLKSEWADVQQQQALQHQTLAQMRAQMNRITVQTQLWTQLSQIQWSHIDVPHIEAQLNEKRQLIKQLNQGDIQQAEQRWQAAKQYTQAMNDALIQANRHEHSLREQQQRTETELAQHLPLAQQSMSDAIRQLLAKRLEKQVFNQQTLRQTEQQLEQLYQQAQAQSRDIEKKAERIMQGFRHKVEWQPYTLEWATDFQAALPDYIAHLKQLQNEGLPELVEQQAARLNKHSSQSLMNFELMFIDIHKEIQNKIQKINDVLMRTEFMQAHHYLRLGSRREHYPHVKEFKQKMMAARGKYTSENEQNEQDVRFNLLQDVISVLKNT